MKLDIRNFKNPPMNKYFWIWGNHWEDGMDINMSTHMTLGRDTRVQLPLNWEWLY